MEEAPANVPAKERVIAASAKPAPAKDGVGAAFIKESLKRAPFLIVGKTTPDTLPAYDVDRDFAYFFYSDYLASSCCLTGKFLRRGHKNNAKSLYDDYRHFFREDADVVSHHAFPSAKTIVETWRSPGIDSVIHARKTTAQICGRTYILGTKAPFDDVELGLTTFRARPLPHEMSDPDDVPLRWFEGAFEFLPDPTAVVDKDGGVLKANALMRPKSEASEAWREAIASCVRRAGETYKIDKSKESWEFSRLRIATDGDEAREEHTVSGHTKHRAWVWKPSPMKDLYVISFREHLSKLPGVVREALV